MPDKWGRSTRKDTVDRALFLLQGWADPVIRQLEPRKAATKIAASRTVGAKDENIAQVLGITLKELQDFMEEHSGTVSGQ